MNQHADVWVTWFGRHAPSVDYFLYLIDESTNYPRIQAWAQEIQNDPGPGQQLRSMATIPLPIAAANTPSLDVPASTIEVDIPSQWQPLADRYTSDPRKRFFVYNGHLHDEDHDHGAVHSDQTVHHEEGCGEHAV